MKLKFFIPGRSQKNNYLGYLQEEKPIQGLDIFGSHFKTSSKGADIQIVYICGPFLKILSLKTLTSIIIFNA